MIPWEDRLALGRDLFDSFLVGRVTIRMKCSSVLYKSPTWALIRASMFGISATAGTAFAAFWGAGFGAAFFGGSSAKSRPDRPRNLPAYRPIRTTASNNPYATCFMLDPMARGWR